jgi:tetratricopeptide (TPR) repeat protein
MNKEYNLPVALAKRHFIITFYECYLDKHPDNLVAWYAKRLALNRLGGPNEAIYRFNKAINKDPKAGGGFESFSRNVTINK